MNNYIIINGELYHADELYHFGVLGMKWGVKRARKQAAKEGVEGRSRLSTGKHYDKVMKEMKPELDAMNKKYEKEYSKLADDIVNYNNRAMSGFNNPNEYKRLENVNKQLNASYYKDKMKIAKKYTNRLNEATLKDIGYKNVDKGMEYLKKKNKFIWDMDL